MQDLDPKCRHFGILWHFMAFYSILWRFGIFAKNSNRKSNPIVPIFFSIFRLFPTFGSTTLVRIDGVKNVTDERTDQQGVSRSRIKVSFPRDSVVDR